MKKLYSTIMMLATIVAALSFTACGGSDDEDVNIDNIISGDNSSNYSYTITKDGEVTKYPNKYLDKGRWNENKHWLFLSHTLTNELFWIYPYSVSYTDFVKGYDIMKEAKYVDYVYPSQLNTYKYKHISGSATVIDNSNKIITIQFSNLKLVYNSGKSEHTIIVDGIAKFDLLI